MDWKEEMLIAMKMMKSACEGNSDWKGCDECPFSHYCDFLLKGSEEITKGKESILPSGFKIPKLIEIYNKKNERNEKNEKNERNGYAY